MTIKVNWDTNTIQLLYEEEEQARRKKKEKERGRIEDIPHRFMHLNTWFPAVSTVAVGLRGMSLIDKTGYWGQAL